MFDYTESTTKAHQALEGGVAASVIALLVMSMNTTVIAASLGMTASAAALIALTATRRAARNDGPHWRFSDLTPQLSFFFVGGFLISLICLADSLI